MSFLILQSYNLERINIDAVNLLFKSKPGLTVAAYAAELGITERTLYRWIKKYKIEIPEKPYLCHLKKAI